MTQKTAQLHHALGELHAALATTANVDPEARRLLEQTMSEIRAALDRAGANVDEGEAPRPAAEGKPNGSLVGQLTETGRHFEETHPTLAGLVQSVVDALAQMGI